MARIEIAEWTAVSKAQSEKIAVIAIADESGGLVEYGYADAIPYPMYGDLVVWVNGPGGEALEEWLLAVDGGLERLCLGCHVAECKCAINRGGA